MGNDRDWKREARRASNKAWAERNPEKTKITQRNWVVNNRGKVNYWAAGRRKSIKQATPKWANQFFIEEIYNLAALRSKMLKRTYHVDHVIPICNYIVCGLHVETNLRIVPARVNYEKHNKYEQE